MRIFFFIQGEGRGHQTQAIALYEILKNAGHTVIGGVVGTTEGRGISTLLQERLPIRLWALPSPALQYSESTKAISVSRTLSKNLRWASGFLKQAAVVDELIRDHQPDLIVNFYEMLCGVWKARFRSSVPVISIAHQYLLQHTGFQLPTSSFLHRRIVNMVTLISGIGTTRKLALSFYEMPDSPSQHIYVVPPLLRPEVQQLESVSEDFILAYMTHYKLGEDLIEWCRRHPEVTIRAFWDHPTAADTEQPLPNLTFQRVNATKFLEAMRRCRGLVSTSGFESICEALYLGKPVMLFPTPGHFEQAVNAVDAVRAGAGIQAVSFLDLDRFLEYLPRHQSVQTTFQQWHRQCASLFLKHVDELTLRSAD